MDTRWAVVALLLVACGDDGATPRDAGVSVDAFEPRYVDIARIPVTVNRNLDVLWVIDDSTGMLPLQARLKSAFPAFVMRLSGVEGGLPNVHIGVVTTDLGAKAADDTIATSIGSGPGSCAGGGKGGNLQMSSLVQGSFISDTKNPDGTRTPNYTGALADAMSSMASVGDTGCGFEQPIEAARRALANNAANVGFRRIQAHLAVIIVTDEDDCSMSHSTLLDTNPATLGPLSSFRCTRFGVTCDQGGATTEQMAQAGDKSGCHSNETSEYLTHVADYAATFSGQAEEMLAVIAGPQAPFNVTSTPSLSLACTGAASATPAPRLASLADRFANNQFASACDADLVPTLTGTADHIRMMIGDPCLTREPSNDCKVTEATSGATVALPKCTMGSMSPVKPCYAFEPDPTNCQAGNHITVKIYRTEAPAPDSVVTVSCKY